MSHISGDSNLNIHSINPSQQPIYPSGTISSLNEIGRSSISQHPDLPPERNSSSTSARKPNCCSTFLNWVVYILTFGLYNLFPKDTSSSSTEQQILSQLNNNSNQSNRVQDERELPISQISESTSLTPVSSTNVSTTLEEVVERGEAELKRDLKEYICLCKFGYKSRTPIALWEDTLRYGEINGMSHGDCLFIFNQIRIFEQKIRREFETPTAPNYEIGSGFLRTSVYQVNIGIFTLICFNDLRLKTSPRFAFRVNGDEKRSETNDTKLIVRLSDQIERTLPILLSTLENIIKGHILTHMSDIILGVDCGKPQVGSIFLYEKCEGKISNNWIQDPTAKIQISTGDESSSKYEIASTEWAIDSYGQCFPKELIPT